MSEKTLLKKVNSLKDLEIQKNSIEKQMGGPAGRNKERVGSQRLRVGSNR